MLELAVALKRDEHGAHLVALGEHDLLELAVLEALADEALRMRLFPGIAFRGADWERRAWVIGTALDVWQIVEAYRDIGSVERMAAEGAASERQIRLALAYYERFPEEVDAAIAADRRPLEQLRDAHPFIAVSDAGA